MNEQDPVLKQALDGDIHAFQSLFAEFQDQLRSYLYRLTTSRSDADDLTHDTFIRAFDKLSLYKGKSSLKTWIFQIATNLAYNMLNKKKRWVEDVSTKAKELVINDPALSRRITDVSQHSPFATYDIREHIDLCFTCISKTLPLEHQLALILRDVYHFSIKEIMLILEISEGVAKYWVQLSRKTMTDVFDRRCALVNKQGVCNQCSELNGWFNPKQDQQEALLKVRLKREADLHSKEELYQMRASLVRGIDPLKSEGNELQEILMKCNRMAMGEMMP